MRLDDELRHAAAAARDDTEWKARPGDADLFDRAADLIQSQSGLIDELERYRTAVYNEGKRLCDIPACNCGGLHDA